MNDESGQPSLKGLTSDEVEERVRDGRINEVPEDPMPSVAHIMATNIFTPVNLIIGVMLVLVVVANGISPDMLFGGVIVSNSVIGIVQEIRARSALRRLAVLTTPRARVRRDGEVREIALEEIVQDDILVLDSDTQVVVDGEVVESSGLELNESLLTGEADPVVKSNGDEVLSGSFVSAGGGAYRATRIGSESYAASLAGEAREFSLVDSELRQGVNQILKVLMALIPPVAGLLLFRLVRTGQEWHDALSGVVAAAVAMVPDGLVLLTSLSFMAGVVTLARRGALLRELAAVELLARVDTLCLDKTGTITTGQMKFAGIEVVDGSSSGSGTDADRSDAGGSSASASENGGTDAPTDEGESVWDRVLAAFAHADPDPNSTQKAIVDAYESSPDWTIEDSVPFSSTRKWSAAAFTGMPDDVDPAVYLGAPEMLLGDAHDGVSEKVDEFAGDGYRVLLLATAKELNGDELPSGLEPRSLVLLEDEVRSDSKETLEYFASQGIGLKVISGDNAATVAAVARRAGVVDAGKVAIDARKLSFDDEEDLADQVEANAVFGRVSPRQKREMMRSLQHRGHKVAMTGDGVNDVLALKDADMGIAMGEGSSASRSVAELVLVESRFAILPGVLAEGRRVVNSIERAANLFIYGTVYSFVISTIVAVMGTQFPFLPRHLTLVRTLTVGLPGFVLALAPDSRVARPGFIRRVVRFCVPAGTIAALATLIVWFYTRNRIDLDQARTACTFALMFIGLGILERLTRSLPPWRLILMGVMAALMAVSIALPISRDFFALSVPPLNVWLLMVTVAAIAWASMWFVPVTADSAEPGPHGAGSDASESDGAESDAADSTSGGQTPEGSVTT